MAELTTAYGDRTLAYMKHIAEKVYGFKVICGDTDSIFVTNVKSEIDINKFLAECSMMLEDTEIELVKIYRRFLLLGKKHYIGIHQDETKDPDIVGMEGKKSDRPTWINNLQTEFAEDLKHGRNPTLKLKKPIKIWKKIKFPMNFLAISLTLRKDPRIFFKCISKHCRKSTKCEGRRYNKVLQIKYKGKHIQIDS